MKNQIQKQLEQETAFISKDKPHLDVRIHPEFYYNRVLDLPTIIKEYEEIETILDTTTYLSCITIQIKELSKIEYQYGSNAYIYLWSRITDLLKEIKETEFRKEDIMVVDIYDPDTYVLFLSAPRKNNTQLLYHLETISERLRVLLEKEIFYLFHPYLKELSRPHIGYALEIKNPMVSNMRIIMRLINNSKSMGKFMATKRQYLSKYNLQKIIIEEKLTTVFQPIVDLQNLEVFGYEALSRGPEDSEFSDPTILFMIASECGLSFELDRLCRHMALIRVPELSTDKKIFVNTLGMTIHDPEFRGIYLKELLKDLDIKPENVIFEISEKLAIDNYEIFRGALKDYNDIGIVHAGDDFGTGYSDLERIMELNPGYLKIDISFIRDIHKSYIKQEIVRAMVSLANRIRSQIIVEGIETREEYEKLRELKVPFGQGYLFARPSETLIPIQKNF